MPESVEIPAPVSTTIHFAATTQSCASARVDITVFSPIHRFTRTLKSLTAVTVTLALIVAHFNERAVTAETVAAASVTISGDPITFTTPIEPANNFDPRIDKGTIADVCFAYGRTKDDVRRGNLLPGAQALSSYMKSIFRWSRRGSLGQCRELLSSTTNRNCDGQKYPDDRPGVRDLPLHFYSDCWSNHAQGRAADLMVGDGIPGRTRIKRGTLLIEWFLAPDAFGNKQARARRFGVQEILFWDRCWDSNEPDAIEITTYADMRECDIGHYDHVHVSFTVAGALGLTSGYGPATSPPKCPSCDPNIRPRK